MRIRAADFQRIVKEELLRYLREAPKQDDGSEDEPAPPPDMPAKPTRPKEKGKGVVRKGAEPPPKAPAPEGGNMAPPSPAPAAPGEPPPDDGAEPPAEDDLAGAEAGEEEPEATPGGDVNKEVAGKTVQSVTLEPKSKILPGAKEVRLGFNETTDALIVLVTSTGQIKFSYRGQLFDLP